ncbi:MAG: response regulator [Clostridia bacterium]|nr:response regulator [Clostridia bacterium]
MNQSFADTLRRLRTEKGLSQQQLAKLLFVDRSSVAHWENGRRVPDAILISQIANALGVDVSVLLNAAAERDADKPAVILLDDERIILEGGLPILKKVMPGAEVTGFTRPSEALQFAQDKRIDLAFLDIEMGKVNGLELCRILLRLNPRCNVVFLTAYMDYSYDAWSTGACGFLIKPLTADAVRGQLRLLRYPVRGLNIQ